MAQSGQPPQVMGSMPGAPPVSTNMPGGPGMQPPRMPGIQGTIRMTREMRQEYEQFVHSQLRQMGSGVPPGPRPPMMPTAPGASQQPRLANFGVSYLLRLDFVSNI